MSLPPYSEDLVKQYNAEVVRPAYREAGREPDEQYPVWSARTVYDYCAGLSWASSAAKHERELRAALGLAEPVIPFAPLPRLVVNGHVFQLETGQPFTAIQCSDFNLFNRYQSGEDITPILQQRSKAGFNMLRVWTLYNLTGIGTLLTPDYTKIPAFLQLCARYGLYVEFTAYTSTELVPHWGWLVAAVQGQTNCLLELVNEGDLPVNAIDMSRYTKPTGILASRGSCGSEGLPPWGAWDYCTFHTNGANEEQRKVGHNAMEVWNGPVITNETSRYPDVGMWVGADLFRQRNLAYDAAEGAALLCAGSCFHSVAGKTSVLWEGPTLEVARAWAAGARNVPLRCQHEAYRHRTDLETADLLRVYQRGASEDCIVMIRK